MDNTVLLLSLILSSLVATTSSLTCVECNVEGEKYCQGNKVTCPPEDDVCVTTLESDTKDGKEMVTFRRHCGQRRMCGYSDSLTTAFGKKKLSSTCCFTSDCSPPSPTFPAGKTDKNGVFCKSCDTERRLSCESSSTMECTGNENKCVLMTNVMTEGGNSFTNYVGGCGTPGWCKLEEPFFSYPGKSYTCSTGNVVNPTVRGK
ncbi:phospholipase A2 inhibitor and Ly6/PLAUR domain-containing protein-like [Bufo gargarizans]|uniref:phospholipase A2 inhibitor and Ly6/PLAUR domain-containing protein-like n=1 Tax=Bufo gargarizans TaxID=30331 RepID=UPI001CF37A4A|nr:phospholipase A2 inhibitor and Ly6/PLAUR domain-containing protein-like [Bufo gargarizans]